MLTGATIIMTVPKISASPRTLKGRGPGAEVCVNTLGLTRLVRLNGALTRLIEFGAFWPGCFITPQLKQDHAVSTMSPSTRMRSSPLSL